AGARLARRQEPGRRYGLPRAAVHDAADRPRVCLERLGASRDEDDIRRRHAAYFAEVAEEGEPELNGPSQDVWAARLDAERDNFRAALAFALESGDGLTALRLAGALRRLWQLHADLGEGRAALEAALAAAPDAPP